MRNALLLLFLAVFAHAAVVVRAGHLLDVTPDAKVIDLSRYTVLPGPTDCHNHLLGDQKNFNPAAPLMTLSAEGVVWGVKNLRTYLDHGFTTVRDACETDNAYGQFALRKGVRRSLIAGPRIFASGAACRSP